MQKRALFCFFFFLLSTYSALAQDLAFHLNDHFFAGKTILKVKRDVNDAYLWVLAKNNEVYRINSNTKAVDNYTPHFAAYNNFRFIDIAGVDQDTVFVATDTTNVIVDRNGAMSIIGAADGIIGNVNSIGISYFHEFVTQGTANLLIGTSNGICGYDRSRRLVSAHNGHHPDFAYEAIYRGCMYSDFKTRDFYTDTTKFLPIIMLHDIAGSRSSIWVGNQFGNHINTAFYRLDYPGFLFWGNEKGIFEEPWLNYNSYVYATNDYANLPYNHVLDGVKINKLADIFGFASLTSPGFTNNLTKENLLVATDQGLYYSSSFFQQSDEVEHLGIYHYDPLGNIVINDLCVNAGPIPVAINYYTHTYPVCEDGVWLATNDGLYLLKADYGKYLNPQQQVKAISFNLPNTPDTVSQTQLCLGSTVNIVLNSTFINNNTIQWVKDGNDIVGQTGNQLNVNASGDYYAVVYAPCEGVYIESNHLKVTIISGPVFSLNYPDKLQYCDSSSVTLNTTGSNTYAYRWYKDGVLTGQNTQSLKVNTSGKYKVEASSCTNTWYASKEVQVDLVSLPSPQITPDKQQYCQGDQATIAVNVPLNATYTINWFRNDTALTANQNQVNLKTSIAGTYKAMLGSTIANCTKTSQSFTLAYTPGPVFTFAYADSIQLCDGASTSLAVQTTGTYIYRWYKNGVLTAQTTNSINVNQTGKYKVEVSACPNSWVASKEVTVNFIKLPVPVILADRNVYCIGDQATLTVNTPVSASYTMNWYRNGTLLAGNQNQTTLSTAIPGDYSVAISNSINCLQTSAIKQLVFNPLPSVTITRAINATLCDGQTVDLKATFSGGAILWSTGERSAQIGVTKAGIYKATVTSAAGCTADTSVSVQFFQNPSINVNDTTLCEFSRQSITLTAPPGFKKYIWNGLQAGNTYAVNHLGTVTLTVEDANGCQATQKINITSQCPDIKIANTFSPNGDGYNDSWAISGLENDPSVNISVYNRTGSLLYQSKGYATAWNGQYNGKKLPTGVYYFVIVAKNGKQTLSGSVSIIY